MTKTWTRGYHEFKSIEGVAENGIVYHKVYRDDKLRFVSIGSWHIYTDDPAYINAKAREVARERAEKAKERAEKKAKKAEKRQPRERMKGAYVGYTLNDLADLADLFDVDDTADICNHYANAYAF